MAEGTPAKSGWDWAHKQYTCRDYAHVKIPRRTANVRDLDETRKVPRNNVRYARDNRTCALLPRIEVSGVEYNRDMETILGGSDGIRTIIFPNMVRTVR